MKEILIVIVLLMGMQVIAQDTSKSGVSFSGYAETYYQYDFNEPADHNRPVFVYSHNRHNEFNLNLGFLKAAYNSDKVRANLALAAGTYMNANYGAEPGTFKNIYEANAGFKLGKKDLWMDVGIFPSHLGFESAISKDCWTLTRSILADNSPYFEAGAKLSYTTGDGKWLLSGLLLNGWQRIKRVDGNSMMSFGTQVTYKPSAKALLNYSSFIGTDKPDSARLTRIFHNLYGIFNITDKLGLTLGLDLGTEEKSPTGKGWNTWYSPILILKYSINDKWALGGRVEYYEDKQQVIIATGTPNGFQTSGFSINVDHKAAGNFLVRIEARTLNSKDRIFVKGNSNVKLNTFVTTSLAVSF